MNDDAKIQKRITTFGKAYQDFITLQSGATLNVLKGKGYEFERLVIRLFELSKCQVRYPFVARNEQIDGVVYTNEAPLLIESKCETSKTDIEPIAKLLIRLQTRPTNVIGCVFSMEGFTGSALNFVERLQQKNLLLWDGADLELLLAAAKRKKKNPVTMKTGFIIKYRALIEYGFNMQSLSGAI